MSFQDQIENLIQNIQIPTSPYDIDVVLEGGGFNGSYELGVLLFLKELEKKNIVKVHRISGASIGAVFAVAYITDFLYPSIDYYTSLRECWRDTLNMKQFHSMIDAICGDISQEVFDALRENKIYITYLDVNKKEQVVQSSFQNIEDLRKALIKSTFIPYVMNEEIVYRDTETEIDTETNKGGYRDRDIDKDEYEDGDRETDNKTDANKNNNNTKTEEISFYIDGGQPFIFHNRNKDDTIKILYISINGVKELTSILSTKNEKNPFGRILYGIIDAYEFFVCDYGAHKISRFCSYVNNWSLHHFLILRIKHILMVCFLYIFSWLYTTYRKLQPYIQESTMYRFLTQTFKLLYGDIILHSCF